MAVASAIGAVCVGSGVGAYGELEVQRALEALPCVETARLAGYLSHPDSRVRGLAAHRYFERRADDDMVRTLVRLLCDPVQSVRGAAATGLRFIGRVTGDRNPFPPDSNTRDTSRRRP